MKPVLTAHDVHLEYSGVRGALAVLKGIEFSLAQGERVCIVGPSGCGKSSLLMVLSGLLRPTSGQINHRGQPWPANLDEAAGLRRTHVGLILQEPILIPYLTLRENIMTAALSADFTNVADRLQAKAEKLGIAKLLDERPANLSVGERQRGSILRAIINEPEVVLADEPTANLDLGNGLAVVRLLQDNLGAAALVLVTHDTRIIDESFVVYRLESGVLSSCGGDSQEGFL